MLHIYFRLFWCKNYRNRLIFANVIDISLLPRFYGPPCILYRPTLKLTLRIWMSNESLCNNEVHLEWLTKLRIRISLIKASRPTRHWWLHCRRCIHCESKKCATFIFTVTLANVSRFLKFFQCRNQKEMAHNKNEKFHTVA